MFRHRALSSAFWFLFLWLVLFILPEWIFLAVTVIIIGLGLYEFFNMVAKKGILVYRYFGIITGCLIPITIYLEFRSSAEMDFILMTIMCLVVFLLQFTRRQTDQALVGIATTVFGIFYIGWFFSFMIKLRFISWQGLDGRLVVLYLLLVTKLGDMGAYFIGKTFGKHHLIPRISPKKSLEGAIGGVIISFLIAVAFRSFLHTLNIIHIFILGLILSALSQIGDLSESLIKRDCQLKDSGSIFPGLGGMLDLIDSLLFTTPIFYFYLRFIT